MFTGREYLYTLGLYDYRHRIYHPGLGRFMQTDPIGFGGDSVNLYRYCGGNPVNRSDPTGLVFPKANNLWAMECHWDSGNSLQGMLEELLSPPQAGMDGGGPKRSLTPKERLKIASDCIKEHHEELKLPDPTDAPAKLVKLEPKAASDYHPMKGIRIDPEKIDNKSVAGMVQQYSHELLHYKDGPILWFWRNFFPNEKRHDEIRARASEIGNQFIRETGSQYLERQ